MATLYPEWCNWDTLQCTIFESHDQHNLTKFQCNTYIQPQKTTEKTVLGETGPQTNYSSKNKHKPNKHVATKVIITPTQQHFIAHFGFGASLMDTHCCGQCIWTRRHASQIHIQMKITKFSEFQLYPRTILASTRAGSPSWFQAYIHGEPCTCHGP